MKSLKCPLTKLRSYQQLMLGRGRRSQLCKTELDYDRRALVNLARDTFVTDKHPLAHWFAQMAEDSLEHSLQAKCELDAITDLEEIAADRLLVHSVDQLRHSLLQRPVRGHCILVVDCVGPKAAAVAVVGADGQVLAIDEIPCSASAGIVNQNVVRLGELVHQHRVTLVALTNGPARRFLVLSLRELMKQSSASGLRWTMADRGGADAYAVSRSALKELSAHNRRHRAAIWVARTLQDPLSELLKVDVNRLRLGSYQRELPQEPLKQLVRETIADCVCRLGLDVRTANVDQLSYVSGVALPQAQQIVGLAQQGTLGSRKELVEKVADWPEMRMRQAIGLLRVYGSEQPLDATLIHPDDYRLAERLVENTDLSAPPAVPAGWQARRATEQAETAIADAPVTAASPVASSVDPAAPAPDVSQAETPLGEVAQAEVAQTDTPSEDAAGAATTEPTVAAAESADPIASAEPVEAALVVAAEQPAVESPVPASEAVAATGAPTPGPLASWVEHPTAVAAAVARPEYPEDLSSDTASPTPTVDVEKLARGWQVGREKLRQIAGCLHDPFADPRLQHPPVPLMTEMPTLTNLQPGTCVWAVVIGVADFGAFVELAPDCSGLIHISRLSSHFIEDPHQAGQVGDLLMTWVVSVDDKKNRVALTALSPEQRATAAAMNAERKEQDEHRRRDRGNSGSHRPAGAAGGNAARGGAHGVAAAGRGAGDGRGRGPARDGDGRGGDGRRGGPGGRSRGGPGGRGQGRPAHAKTVVVTSKKPKANITDAMKEGEEPLRSFSDLMQFYQAKRTDEPTKETKSDQS
ncbi:MAG: S1 RNA-binding domain-containing protein [Pirellulaceae bacterium]|nr:S1 RNA-binding domain-containing protein [Pirellulaceae bacterium]